MKIKAIADKVAKAIGFCVMICIVVLLSIHFLSDIITTICFGAEQVASAICWVTEDIGKETSSAIGLIIKSFDTIKNRVDKTRASVGKELNKIKGLISGDSRPKQLLSSEKEFEALRKENIRLQEENKQLKEKIASETLEIRLLKDEVDSLTREIENLINENNRLKEENSSLKQHTRAEPETRVSLKEENKTLTQPVTAELPETTAIPYLTCREDWSAPAFHVGSGEEQVDRQYAVADYLNQTVLVGIQIQRAPSWAPSGSKWEKLGDRTLVLSWGNIKNTYQSDESGLVKNAKIPPMGKVEYEVWHNGKLEQEGSFDYNKGNKEGVVKILIRDPK